MKVAVTGGAGYIGSHVTHLLKEEGFTPVVLDNLSTGYRQACGDVDFYQVDLKDQTRVDEIFQAENFDAVMHFAGSIIVPESVENPILYYQNNTMNTLKLLEICLKHQVRDFIFSSTAAVYGIKEDGVCVEDDQTHPINPYGFSKLMSEQMLKDTAFAHQDFHYGILRYFNVSGAHPDALIGQATPRATHLIKVNVEAATGKRQSVSIFGDDFDTPDGTGIRDYIHVMDLAAAHIELLKKMKKDKKSALYNVGYGIGTSVKEVIQTVKKVTESDYTVNIQARRPGDPAKLISSNEKILNETSWRPRFNQIETLVKHAYQFEQSETLKSWKK